MPSTKQMHNESANKAKLKLKKPVVESANRSAEKQTHPADLFQQAKNDTGSLTHGDVLQLQHSVGNQAVDKLLPKMQLRPAIQAKRITEGAADAYEQEADRSAAQVMSAPIIQPSGQTNAIPRAKPLAASITSLGRQPGSAASQSTLAPSADFASQLSAARGGGRPLPGAMREFMERSFGADFRDVRLYSGSQAARLNQEIGAQAFTQGQDIFLGEGKENAESNEGKDLLAHELTHVVQQTGTGTIKTQGENQLHSGRSGCLTCQPIQRRRGKKEQAWKQDRKRMKQTLQRGFTEKDWFVRRVASGGGKTAISSNKSHKPDVGPETTAAWNAMIERNHVRDVERRDIDNCAEAHLWLKLTDAGISPSDTVVTVGQYTKKGKIRGDRPCGNCAQWVHKEFKDVIGHV